MRTLNMELMFSTELTSQLPIFWLKELAPYSAARDGWPCGVRGEIEGWGRRRRHSDNTCDEETRTLNMSDMLVTKLVSHPPMGLLKAAAPYSAARNGWHRGLSDVIEARR
jgi:hypothetical protein